MKHFLALAFLSLFAFIPLQMPKQSESVAKVEQVAFKLPQETLVLANSTEASMVNGDIAKEIVKTQSKSDILNFGSDMEGNFVIPDGSNPKVCKLCPGKRHICRCPKERKKSI